MADRIGPERALQSRRLNRETVAKKAPHYRPSRLLNGARGELMELSRQVARSPEQNDILSQNVGGNYGRRGLGDVPDRLLRRAADLDRNQYRVDAARCVRPDSVVS